MNGTVIGKGHCLETGDLKVTGRQVLCGVSLAEVTAENRDV